MQKFFFNALLSVSVFLLSCNNNTPDPAVTDSFSLDSVRAAVALSNTTFGSGFSNGDSSAFVSHYTSDACINPSNMPKLCGTKAITAFFNGGYAMGIRGAKITTEELTGGKDGVIETGIYEMYAANNVSIDKGKFMVLWKMENGKWKMHRDIWNSDLPAAAPAKK